MVNADFEVCHLRWGKYRASHDTSNQDVVLWKPAPAEGARGEIAGILRPTCQSGKRRFCPAAKRKLKGFIYDNRIYIEKFDINLTIGD